MNIKINVDNKDYTLDVDGDTKLIWILREDLNLKHVKVGCCEGSCGECRVFIDGRSVQSCSMAIKNVGNSKVRLEK